MTALQVSPGSPASRSSCVGQRGRASSQRSIDYHSPPAFRQANHRLSRAAFQSVSTARAGPDRSFSARSVPTSFRRQNALNSTQRMRGLAVGASNALLSLPFGYSSSATGAAPGPGPVSAASAGPVRQNRRGARPRQSAPAARATGSRSAAFEAHDGPLHRLCRRRLRLVQQRLGQQRPLRLVLHHVHRVLRTRARPAPAAPERLQVPRNSCGCCVTASAAIRRASSCSGSVIASARSSTRSTSVSADGPNLDVVPPPQRRLPQLLAHDRRVDPQLLRRVGGKLVPRQLFRHAPDMRQQVVHGLHLLLRAGARKHLPRPLDQVVGLAAAPRAPPRCRPPRPARGCSGPGPARRPASQS